MRQGQARGQFILSPVTTQRTLPAENPQFAAAPQHTQRPAPIVLDTNVLVDAWVFHCAVAHSVLQQARCQGSPCLATDATRSELERVLTYVHLQARMASQGQTAEDVLAQFDACMTRVPAAPRSQPICRDADDQKFVDLAVQHQATLVSQDKDVLRLAKRLALRGVAVWQPQVLAVSSIFIPATSNTSPSKR